MLGLMDSVGGDDDFDFQVAPPGDFEPRSMEAPLSKDLDAELQGTGLEFDMPSDTAPRGAAAAGAAAGAGAAGSGRVSLQIEIGGLTPDLQRVLRAVEGKVIDLPSLQIRVKADDLG